MSQLCPFEWSSEYNEQSTRLGDKRRDLELYSTSLVCTNHCVSLFLSMREDSISRITEIETN